VRGAGRGAAVGGFARRLPGRLLPAAPDCGRHRAPPGATLSALPDRANQRRAP